MAVSPRAHSSIGDLENDAELGKRRDRSRRPNGVLLELGRSLSSIEVRRRYGMYPP